MWKIIRTNLFHNSILLFESFCANTNNQLKVPPTVYQAACLSMQIECHLEHLKKLYFQQYNLSAPHHCKTNFFTPHPREYTYHKNMTAFAENSSASTK